MWSHQIHLVDAHIGTRACIYGFVHERRKRESKLTKMSSANLLVAASCDCLRLVVFCGGSRKGLRDMLRSLEVSAMDANGDLTGEGGLGDAARLNGLLELRFVDEPTMLSVGEGRRSVGRRGIVLVMKVEYEIPRLLC